VIGPSEERSGRPLTEPTAEDASDRGRGYLRTTLKHGGIYTIGMLLSRLVGFIMIPIYTRVLTPGDYGVLEILSLSTDILGMLAGMGIGIAVMKLYYAAADENERRLVVSTAMTLLIVVFASVASAGVALAATLAPLLLGLQSADDLFRLAVVVMAFASTIEVPLAVLRARQHSTVVVTVGLARLTLSLGLNIVFVVVLRLGVAGVLYSSLISSLVVGGYLTLRLYRECGLRVDFPVMRRLVAFGAPLIVWNIGSFVLHYSDRFFLRYFDSLESVGLYSLGYRFAMLVSLVVVGPFSEIWIPKALEIQRREGDGSAPILASILRGYNLILVTVALCVSLFAGDVIRIATGTGFHAAASIVPLLTLAMVIFGYRNIAQIGALISGRSDLVAIATSVAAVTVTALNVVLIPIWGVTGAALSTLGAFLFEFLVMRTLSRRVHPLEIGLTSLAAPIAIAALVFGATQLIGREGLDPLPSLAVGLLALVAYVAALVVTGVVPRELRQAIWQGVQQPSRAIEVLRGA